MRKTAIILALPALSACGGPLSTLQPEGPAADSIALLWWIVFWLSCAIFLAVSAVVVAAARTPARLRSIGPSQWIVGGGLVFPTVVLIFIVVWSLALGERLLPRSDEQIVRIEVTARKWMWEFAHGDAGAGIGTAHIPAGRDVEFAVISEDVIHSFWIPRLGGKIDAIPGHVNVVRLRADRPGRYAGICAEYCGTGHSGMRFVVIAHATEDYEQALAELAGEGE